MEQLNQHTKIYDTQKKMKENKQITNFKHIKFKTYDMLSCKIKTKMKGNKLFCRHRIKTKTNEKLSEKCLDLHVRLLSVPSQQCKSNMVFSGNWFGIISFY